MVGWFPWKYTGVIKKAVLNGWRPGWRLVSPKRFESRFGFAEVRVQLKPDGSVDFDRLIVGEAPSINAVLYGYRHGMLYVGVVVQGRPFADNPDGTPADPSIVFGQPCAMGFNLEKVSGEDTAIREASEEAGTESAVLEVEHLGHHNPNPTFCATWNELFAIHVDMERIDSSKFDRSELIYRAEYLQLAELIRRIGLGDYDGVNYRSATANDAVFVWLCKHPEIMYRHIV